MRNIFLWTFFCRYIVIFLDLAKEDVPVLNLAYKALIGGLFIQPLETNINEENTSITWIVEQAGDVGGDSDVWNQVKVHQLGNMNVLLKFHNNMPIRFWKKKLYPYSSPRWKARGPKIQLDSFTMTHEYSQKSDQ